MRTTLILLVAALAFAGCAAQVASPNAGATPTAAAGGKADADIATLSFSGDWSVSQSAPLVKGQSFMIHYDPSRLPDCRGKNANGEDTWHIAAYYSLDGEEPLDNEIELTELVGGGRLEPPTSQVVDQITDVPIGIFGGGHDFALWFRGWDETGCEQWDSDYGQNFHFQIENAPPTADTPPAANSHAGAH